MATDKREFGNFLRELINQTGKSQAEFYAAVEITKRYFVRQGQSAATGSAV